jgi:hypothetical protein
MKSGLKFLIIASLSLAIFPITGWSASVVGQNLAITVTSGGGGTSPRPDSTNTGYLNAPEYPGSLSPCPTTLTSNTTYNFVDCTGGIPDGSGKSNITFYGSRFRSNAVVDANVKANADNMVFNYCTFMPSTVASPPVSYNGGYQYGINQTANVQLTVDHSDFWGFGNGMQVSFSSQTKPLLIQNSWFHDTRADGGIDHTDGILANDGGASIAYVKIHNNTIEAVGNTQCIAMQGTHGFINLTVTNNYVSGFGYTVSLGNNGGVPYNGQNVIFQGNTFETYLRPVWNTFYGAWSDTNGNVWKCNKLHVITGSYYTLTSDDGKYWWVDNTFHATDWNGNAMCS